MFQFLKTLWSTLRGDAKKAASIAPNDGRSAIQINSDGTIDGTQVLDQDGNLIGYVQRVRWTADVRESLTRCTIHVVSPSVHVQVALDRVMTHASTLSFESVREVAEDMWNFECLFYRKAGESKAFSELPLHSQQFYGRMAKFHLARLAEARSGEE
jgi:hypothetical protein